jgi:alanyl-tRNA synthetase
MNILSEYQKFCENEGIFLKVDNNVKSYDDTTLFCPAGMQQFKDKFIDKSYKGTIANVQSCIRLNDFDEIGDGTHFAYFNMLGLFSFRELSVKQTINLFLKFIKNLGLKIDYATIHPDKRDWKYYYPDYMPLKNDDDCKWTDGKIGGYCTEFYVDGIEIGNIVNPLGDCIDVGFGLERLDMLVNGKKQKSRIELLKECALKIIEAGFKPSNLKQGYVLRKILREIYKSGEVLDHQYFKDEIERQKIIKNRYEKLKNKNKDKTKEWWFDTHGIDLEEVNNK